jgi:hypothetical protein
VRSRRRSSPPCAPVAGISSSTSASAWGEPTPLHLPTDFPARQRHLSAAATSAPGLGSPAGSSAARLGPSLPHLQPGLWPDREWHLQLRARSADGQPGRRPHVSTTAVQPQDNHRTTAVQSQCNHRTTAVQPQYNPIDAECTLGRNQEPCCATQSAA